MQGAGIKAPVVPHGPLESFSPDTTVMIKWHQLCPPAALVHCQGDSCPVSLAAAQRPAAAGTQPAQLGGPVHSFFGHTCNQRSW